MAPTGVINASLHVLYFFPDSLSHLLTLAPDFYHTNLSSLTICQSRDMKSVQTSSMSQLHTWVCGPGMCLWLRSGLIIQAWVSGLGLGWCFKRGQSVCSIPPGLCHIGYINNGHMMKPANHRFS